jgi:hypothetical protein
MQQEVLPKPSQCTLQHNHKVADIKNLNLNTAHCVLSVSLPILYLVTVWLQNRPSQPVARRQHDARDTVLRCSRGRLKGKKKTYFGPSIGKFHIKRIRDF